MIERPRKKQDFKKRQGFWL